MIVDRYEIREYHAKEQNMTIDRYVRFIIRFMGDIYEQDIPIRAEASREGCFIYELAGYYYTVKRAGSLIIIHKFDIYPTF